MRQMVLVEIDNMAYAGSSYRAKYAVCMGNLPIIFPLLTGLVNQWFLPLAETLFR